MSLEFTPKILTTLKEGYTKELFLSDLMAGVLVGIIALPLAIAFAIASGATPQQGLYTAIIAGFIISLLSGSRVQIGGPTGAFIAIVVGIIHTYGMDGLTIATIMAGFMLMLMGFLRLGKVIEYIPYPVTVGFTAGISIIITIGQIPALLGLTLSENPREVVEKLALYKNHLSDSSFIAIGMTIITILIIQQSRKISSKIPGALVAIVIFSLLAVILQLPIETIGDRFGTITMGIPSPSLPPISYDLLVTLLPAAFAIALLGGIESLLSAVVADGMTGYKHRSNMELVGQGVANIVTPLFGGIPATGAIARTATNIKNGGRTPFAGIIHAIMLLILAFFLGSLVSYIPFAVLAGILLLVAYNMGEWHLFGKILKSTKSDAIVLMITFILTVFVDLTVAIPAGIVMAAILFMKRMIDVADIKLYSDEEELYQECIEKDIEIFEINGPFFFGVSSRFQHLLTTIYPTNKVLIFRMGKAPFIDVAGIKALEDTAAFCKKHGILFMISSLQEQPRKLLLRSPLLAPIALQSYDDFEVAKDVALEYIHGLDEQKH